MKKVLIPGGTGAMGVYLVPELLKMGYAVDVLSLDDAVSDHKDLTYTKVNAKDPAVIAEQLKKGYDAVVDFMIYPCATEYETFLPLYLANTDHYFYLSSYRVYANEERPVKETSPRLLDVSRDKALLTSGDYSIYKAQGEDFLRGLDKSNYTILRPAITYSKRRFQLTIMEMNLVVRSMLAGTVLPVPEEAMGVEATMSWAGDVAKMIARLVLNKEAFGETYSACTAEHMPWGDVAEIYKKIGGLRYEPVDTETFLSLVGNGSIYSRRQLVYDRFFDRIMDNAKILSATGMKQSELMPLADGLARELAAFPKDFVFAQNNVYDNIQRYFKGNKK